MPSLLVLSGSQKDEVFEVVGGETLGRDEANTIQISQPGVSRRHVQFAAEGGAIWVIDLGSVNGTAVNGERIEKHKLADGDEILVSNVTLKFRAASRAPKAPPKSARRARVERSPTEPFDAERARKIVVEDEAASAEPVGSADYSVDARLSFTATDLLRSPVEQIVLLQRRLELIFEIQQALAAVKDRDELLGKMLEKLFQVFPQASRGMVLLGPSIDELEPAIVRNRGGGEAKGASLSRTIAREVFEQRKAILAHDASKDDRFAKSTSLVGMEVRSFVVAPLLFREEAFGFIQLDSASSRERFSPADLNLLAGLASSAALFLKSLKLFETVAREVKEREAIHSELRVASQIQAGLLPKTDPDSSWLEVAARMRTAKEVGGDYYDYLQSSWGGPTAEPGLFIVIGDVSGKGVPAGLVMVMARSILRSLTAGVSSSPRLSRSRRTGSSSKTSSPGMFLSLLLGRCDPQKKSIRFAGCGHERPLVYRAKSETVERLSLGGLVLGVVADNSKNVAEATVVLEPGDQVLLYTDGVPEAMNPEGKQWKVDRLEATLAAHGTERPKRLLDTIEAEVARHVRGAEQHDDITLIAIRRKV